MNSLLKTLFGTNPPETFTEKSTDKEIIISIPWELKQINLLSDAAGITHQLSGFFNSSHGTGYKVGHSISDRMTFHFFR